MSILDNTNITLEKNDSYIIFRRILNHLVECEYYHQEMNNDYKNNHGLKLLDKEALLKYIIRFMINNIIHKIYILKGSNLYYDIGLSLDEIVKFCKSNYVDHCWYFIDIDKRFSQHKTSPELTEAVINNITDLDFNLKYYGANVSITDVQKTVSFNINISKEFFDYFNKDITDIIESVIAKHEFKILNF